MRQKWIGFEARASLSGLNLLGQHRAAVKSRHGNEDRPSVARSAMETAARCNPRGFGNEVSQQGDETWIEPRNVSSSTISTAC